MSMQLEDAAHLVGTFRRFGEAGPVYEVLQAHENDGQVELEVELPETGEKTTVSLEDVLSDPAAE
jgi:hypothetical protein